MPNTILVQLIRQSNVKDGLIHYVLHTCDVNEISANGESPLLAAVKWSRDGIVSALLDRNADIHYRDTSYYRDTILSWAVYLGKTTLVRRLLRMGADPNTQTRMHGNTVLIWACKRHFFETFVALMEAGADPTKCAYNGENVFSVVPSLTLFRIYLDEWKENMKSAIYEFMERWGKQRMFEQHISAYIASFVYPYP